MEHFNGIIFHKSGPANKLHGTSRCQGDGLISNLRKFGGPRIFCRDLFRQQLFPIIGLPSFYKIAARRCPGVTMLKLHLPMKHQEIFVTVIILFLHTFHFLIYILYLVPRRILTWIFGPKRVANGEKTRLHIEELRISYLSANIFCGLQLPGEPHRSTRLLQLTGRWQYDGIM